ncbi:MAG: DUF4136 domain-containing protein [Erythrobacter sp.]
MKQLRHLAYTLAAATALAGCASVPPPGPAEITRFHDEAAMATLGAAQPATAFVASAPGTATDSLELAPYKAAVAAELAKLGVGEAGNEAATLIAQVQLERFTIGSDDDDRRGPVSVGVGGSTGSYGSGLGLGIGINLGGGGSRERQGTRLAVMLRDKVSGRTVWEGRAQLAVASKSPLANPAQGAPALARALFRDFPGKNGETIEVEVTE